MNNARWRSVVLGGVVLGAAGALALPMAGCGGSSSQAAAGSGADAGAAGRSSAEGGSGGTSLSGNGGAVSAGHGGVAESAGSSGDAGAAAAGLGGATGMGGASGGAAGLSGTAGLGGSAGTAGHPGNGGTAQNEALGQACSADLDCGSGLKCLLPNAATLTEGPPNGLCTLACTTDAPCEAVSPGASCVSLELGKSYCFEGCTPGDPGPDITLKCHGRIDAACESFSSGATLCLPFCVQDADCGGTLFCDHYSGLCSKTKPTGDPDGTPCDPNAPTGTCLGTCLITSAAGVTPEQGICTELCPLGVPCAYNGTHAGGLCAGPLTEDAGLLDLAYCEAGCQCTGDCKLPGDVCQAWTADDSDLKGAIGSAGFCYLNAIGSTELTCK